MDKDFIKNLGFQADLLEKVTAQLKEEFIGLDNIIDNISSQISSWYLLPELQERPIIINLWGMTGVGKTSLVKRLIELLKLEDIYYHFDLGEIKGDGLNVINQLRNLSNIDNNRPSIIVFDEFQLARTISEKGHELIEPNNRIIWKLLDNGKFEIQKALDYEISTLHDHIMKLEFLIKNGVKAHKGKVYEQIDFFHMTHEKYFERRIFEEKKEKKTTDLLVPPSFYFDIYDCHVMGFKSAAEIEDHLLQMDEIETLEFLKHVLNQYIIPQRIDCSRSLIINIGNLNSLFPMSNNFSIDLSADEFYKQSLKITPIDVKNKLGELFRQEQVARLGNNHIIYSAIKEEQYQTFIHSRLETLSNKFKEITGAYIHFHPSFLKYLFDLSVTPSLGYRPILTSIDAEVQSHIGKMARSIVVQKLEVKKVELYLHENNVVCTYSKDKRSVFHELLKVNHKYSNRNQNKDIITAVHEAGHVLAGLLLEGKLPEQVVCKSMDRQTLGYVYYDSDEELLSKKSIRPKLARHLGGRAAEEVIFGQENITLGANSDFEKATELASNAVKSYGFGSALGTFSNTKITDKEIIKKELEAEIEQEIHEAYLLALETLRINKKWLKKLSMKLFVHEKVNRTELVKILEDLDIKPEDYEPTYNYIWEFMHVKNE